MYNIIHKIDFLNGSKIKYKVVCPNSTTTRYGIAIHGGNKWNKVGYGVYTCSECGCRITMKSEFKEEEIVE